MKSVTIAAAALAALSSLGVAGCTTGGAGAAGSGGGVATAVTVATANPLLGAGAGAAAGWATNQAEIYLDQQMHAAIAGATAKARPKEIVPWEAPGTLRIGQARGTLTVTDFRRVGDQPCKDVVFTVVEGPADEIGDYAGTVCREPEGWQMAEAYALDEQQWTPPEERRQAAPADKAWQPPASSQPTGGRAAS